MRLVPQSRTILQDKHFLDTCFDCRLYYANPANYQLAGLLQILDFKLD